MNKCYINILIISLLLIASSKVIGQVGIGTISPDPSSILDITSTTQGMLAPRMTSSERINIASPVKGLLVFDIEQDAFYYFSGSIWVKLEGSINRNNYKLVKSISDLSDELVAGGGAKYLLNENFLYEINGTIIVDFPIDLNEAYVRGQDTREDALFNLTGSALFTGSTGGNLRDFLILGSGNPAFNINSSATQSLIVNSVVFVGCSSVGTISNLGLVFFNVSQFINCSTGITASDITSLLMSNIFWRSNSLGTFLTLSGTFDDVQISSGRVAVDNGEIGLDVSSNPIINNTGSINGVAFTGTGTRVNGYTTGGYPGYLFSNKWDVSTPGLKLEIDDNAVGDIHLNAPVGSGFETTFSGAGTSSRVKIVGTTNSASLFRFTSSGNNRIIYDGIRERNFQISTSLSFQGDNNNTIYVFYIAKNGTVVEDTRVYREVGENNDVGAVAIIGSMDLVQGDYIEVWAERVSGGGDLLTVSLNLTAK